jgi:ATP synthase F1 epsilon subunit
MEDNFTLQIISPEKILFSDSVKMVTIPSYEGDMSILKNHISIISFLRPGRVKIKKNDESLEEFFLDDGTIEFVEDNLVILSSSAMNLKNISKEFLDDLLKNTQDSLNTQNITDHERYILNHKLDVLKEVNS